MFNKVYEIATKSTSYEEFKKNIEPINVAESTVIQDGCLVTVGAQLAREGKHESVLWMQQHGDNIHYIAQGYALAGQHDKVEEYRQKGANVGLIAQSYARVGEHEKAWFYYTEFKSTIAAIAQGYA